jgi:hypothetical protein
MDVLLSGTSVEELQTRHIEPLVGPVNDESSRTSVETPDVCRIGMFKKHYGFR